MPKPKRELRPNGPSQRQLRVAEMIRHKMSELLSRGEIHDDVLAGEVITIPEVRLTSDLKIATVYVMPLGGKNIEPIIKALAQHKRFIRGEISRTINMKYAPDLRFKFDEMFDEAARIDRLLHSPRVRADVEKAASPPEADGETEREAEKKRGD